MACGRASSDYGRRTTCWWRSTVCGALIGVVGFGTLTGSMLPFILRRPRLRPATASAPFVATLVDVTGLCIYFGVAALDSARDVAVAVGVLRSSFYVLDRFGVSFTGNPSTSSAWTPPPGGAA